MAFENHEAKIVLHKPDIIILDWRNKNGSREYYVRYILDKPMGSLIIQGDLGTAVASWYNRVEAHDMVRYVQNIPYFVEKLVCSTDKYTYHADDVKNDIEEHFIQLAVGCELNEQKEILHDMEYVVDKVIEAHHNNTSYDDDTIAVFGKYDIEPCDIDDFGRRISERVKLWSEGFARAYEEVFING